MLTRIATSPQRQSTIIRLREFVVRIKELVWLSQRVKDHYL